MKVSMPRFDQAAVLVVGDVMLDRYWHGGTSRISPEAPVPVVKVEQIEDRPGGEHCRPRCTGYLAWRDR
jgi:D-beta-D-heptose 7-phosphate kinase/D-beta-D-heptose 1-phosphate adenosyltransferase